MKRRTSPNQFIGYVRVSTQRQGRSGLGLDAQRRAIDDHIQRVGGRLHQTFIEVESGKQNERPQLREALRLATLTGSTLLIAKLDRLSRKARFILELLEESGVEFVCCDNPHANTLTIQFLAIIAEMEGDQISARTKAALQAAKARGVRLGRPSRPRELFQSVTTRVDPKLVAAKLASIRPYFPGKTDVELKRVTGVQLGAAMGNRTQATRRARFLEDLSPIVDDIRRSGVESAKGLARVLNERGIQTLTGSRWSHVTAGRVLRRLES